MYRDGEAQINITQALYWFNEAMKKGNKIAEFEYQQLCKQDIGCKM